PSTCRCHPTAVVYPLQLCLFAVSVPLWQPIQDVRPKQTAFGVSLSTALCKLFQVCRHWNSTLSDSISGADCSLVHSGVVCGDHQELGAHLHRAHLDDDPPRADHYVHYSLLTANHDRPFAVLCL